MQTAILDTFHDVARLRREELFGDNRLTPITCIEDAQTAAMGWVGRDYTPSGILMIGINPGGGTDTYRRNPTDALLYGRLRAFRDATGGARSAAFTAANDTWVSIQRTHAIWRLISEVLAAARIRAEQAAFLNMLPFRTRGDKPAPWAVMQQAWARATSRQVAALAPGAIVCLGYKAADALARLAPLEELPPVFRLKRAIGDSYVTDEARATLAELRRHFAKA
jgi:hypothetical protein